MRKYLHVLTVAVLLLSCSKPEEIKTTDFDLEGSTEDLSGGNAGGGAGLGDPTLWMRAEALQADTIPDFSRVGYKWGDEEIPSYQNVVNVAAPTGGDDRRIIQNAIDAAPANSVIQLQAGEYLVDSMLFMDRSGLILRGAPGKATTIRATGKSMRDFITMGRSLRNDDGSRVVESTSWAIQGVGTTIHSTSFYWAVKSSSRVVSDNLVRVTSNTPCGSLFVEVENPSGLSVGDRIVIYRPATALWLDSIHMREIGQDPSDEDVITQWTERAYSIYWERRIIGLDGCRVFLDSPIVMALESRFGGGCVAKCSWSRVKESGIEDLVIKSDYEGDEDVQHAVSAIRVAAAEHCWVRNVETWYFSSSAVALDEGALNVTVSDCESHDPKSQINGGYRYAFHISGGQQCLVENCRTWKDRHSFVTASKVAGPNVFLDCIANESLSVVGPHQRWATGGLYDMCSTDGGLELVDGAHSGTGHGWRGANFVLWNCTAGYICVQSPWDSAKNWAIGCSPTPFNGGRTYFDSLGDRPSGVVRERRPDEPESLYASQLSARHASGLYVSKIVGE